MAAAAALGRDTYERPAPPSAEERARQRGAPLGEGGLLLAQRELPHFRSAPAQHFPTLGPGHGRSASGGMSAAVPRRHGHEGGDVRAAEAQAEDTQGAGGEGGGVYLYLHVHVYLYVCFFLWGGAGGGGGMLLIALQGRAGEPQAG